MKFKKGDVVVCVKSHLYGSADDDLKLKLGGYYQVKDDCNSLFADKATIHISDFKHYGTNELYGYYEDRFELSLKYERQIKLKKLKLACGHNTSTSTL